MIGAALAFGFIGWVVENVAAPPVDGSWHWSPYVPRGVPFLPVYAVGGAMLSYLAPRVQGMPLPAKAGTYALGTTALELVACSIDRALGNKTWDYGAGSCLDIKHTAAWTVAALLAEPFLK